jgi:cation diffusion facilitator family transporter
MDCADDAADIERAVRRVPSATMARVSVASHLLTLPAEVGPGELAAIREAVAKLGYRLEPAASSTPGSPSSSHLQPSYRRALWIVVGLNLGYGIVEAVGGFLAGSQALKADALDFLGDGLITILGLVAIRRSASWRARTALIQGVFLAVLGLGVLANTAYRFVVQQMPSPEAMGVLAVVALIVNLAAAVVLLPHRKGDANVRAVWLFSRNDAIGNLLVLAAAAFVALTGTPWPDVIVGAGVAALFLQSSLVIIRSAKHDLVDAAATRRRHGV